MLESHTANRKWDEATQTVLWKEAVGQAFPTLSFAVWSEAENSYQTEHFGCVPLEGDELADYSMW